MIMTLGHISPDYSAEENSRIAMTAEVLPEIFFTSSLLFLSRDKNNIATVDNS